MMSLLDSDPEYQKELAELEAMKCDDPGRPDALINGLEIAAKLPSKNLLTAEQCEDLVAYIKYLEYHIQEIFLFY
jgi:hypothetical protein